MGKLVSEEEFVRLGKEAAKKEVGVDVNAVREKEKEYITAWAKDRGFVVEFHDNYVEVEAFGGRVSVGLASFYTPSVVHGMNELFARWLEKWVKAGGKEFMEFGNNNLVMRNAGFELYRKFEDVVRGRE